MALTNFESNLKTIRLSIDEGYQACVVIKRLNTGSYKYITRALNNPGSNVYYEVYKYEKSGKLVGKTLVDASYYGINYDNKYFSIPDSITKTILEFHRAIYG